MSLSLDEVMRFFSRISELNNHRVNKNENLASKSEIDLHYLRVKEANSIAIAFITYHVSLRTSTIDIITGRGLHSPNRTPEIKPKVERYLKLNNFIYHDKENNSGVVIAHLDGQCKCFT